MATFFITATHGPDDPTRASLPFHVARGAVETGHDVGVALMGDAASVMKECVRDSIIGVAVPPLKDLFQFAVEHGVRVYV